MNELVIMYVISFILGGLVAYICHVVKKRRAEKEWIEMRKLINALASKQAREEYETLSKEFGFLKANEMIVRIYESTEE